MQPTGNLLLDSLSRSVREVILTNAQRIQLRANCEVFKTATPMRLAFVTAGAVSITIKSQDGFNPEVSVIGREGLLGYQLLLGAESLSGSHLMHGEGTGLIVSRRQLQTLFEEDAEFRKRILELTVAQSDAARQLTVCSLAHGAEQRIPRWLLSVSAALGSSTVPVKQDVISAMLGIRRTTVSLINTRLERAGVIRTRRGMVTILHRAVLVQRSCECSQALAEFNEALYQHSPQPASEQNVLRSYSPTGPSQPNSSEIQSQS